MPTPLITGLGLTGTPSLPLINPPLKIKILIEATAASATGVEGVVFSSPQGGALTGNKIGEFYDKVFEATLDYGEARLLVSCAEFGGGNLTYLDTPVVVVRNATYTTGVIPVTLIEE